MKKVLALVAMVSAVACASANAAIVSLTPPSGTPGAIHSAYVNSEADVFDTIDVKFTPNPGTTFTNTNGGLNAGVPRNPGEAFTFPNRKLNADPGDVDGGQGWTFFGLINNANTLEFTGTPIGGLINTNNAPLFLGNVNLSSPTGTGVLTVKGLRLGVEVFNQTLTFGAIPEPATMAMAGMGLIGMVAVSRRRKA